MESYFGWTINSESPAGRRVEQFVRLSDDGLQILDKSAGTLRLMRGRD
jgi:hypothetical protein